MVSASACYTSWKNLSSFSHALSELGKILVIDLFDPVCAEHTNLLAGLLCRTGISFLFHDFSSYRNKVKLICSERNVAVTEYFLKIAEVAVRHTVISCGLLWSCLLRRSRIIVIVIVLGSAVAAVILITAAVAAAFTLAAYKLDIVHLYICGIVSNVGVVLILIVVISQGAFYANKLTLVEIS